MVEIKNKHIFSKYYILSTVGIVSFFIFVLLATPARAVTISQLNLEINARPGETIEQLVQLYDESFSGVTVYPVVYNFTADPNREGSVQLLTDPADLKPDRNWIKFGTPPKTTETDEATDTEIDMDQTIEDQVDRQDSEAFKLTLPVEGTLADFPYYIEIPEDAEPGTHLISLVFQLKPQLREDLEGSAVFIGANVATNIFLKVLGATIDDIDVDFQSGIFTNKDPNLSPAERKEFFQPKNFFLKPPVDFLVTVSNQGNTHQKPDGNIRIVNDLFGSRTEKLLINPENKIILPKTERTFDAPSFGQGLMIGKYRAKISLLYGNPLRPVEKEIAFWIVPLVEILIVIGAILLLIIIIIVIRKIRKKGKAKKELEREEKMRQQIIEELQGKKGKSDEKGQAKEAQKKKKKGSNKKK